ncbi:uncharacterized protein LOC113360491 [Papaver somniferum]|uniref:uncharacterized protein LOC113360491 n=1 Tax=Papaver somniferum TaxID=3469 RepID=UPI000E6FD24C|nr:uncharacterized protein LOC113360491 [Papaver somniferum]
MDSHLFKFWWGETLDTKDRKLHLLGWDILCSPKAEGGLGFRKAELNNLAMLARNAWRILENPNCMLATAKYFPRTDFLNASVLLNDSVSRLPDEAQCLFVTIMWSLWTSRNNLIFQNLKENHVAVLARARDMLLTRKPCLIVSPNTSVSLCDKWMPPSFGWIKCNTDGAYDDITGANGAGYMMRDFSSKASFCASLVFEVKSSEEAEARAIWAVLKKTLEQMLTHIIVESDAKSLIDHFSASLFDGDSRTGAILKDIQFFSSKLVACVFNFQPRVCNYVAHELVQWTKTNNTSMYWFVPPVWLLPTVEGIISLFDDLKKKKKVSASRWSGALTSTTGGFLNYSSVP